MARDPYQILGLPPGAPAAEVKRAYRRLAKEHHPDSAGEAALPRFLEIQRAYEALTAATWRAGTRRPASAEPWRADPARARPAAEPPPKGPRARPDSTTGSRAGSGKGSSTGSGTGARSTGAAGSSRSSGSTGATGRRRSTKKATFGSTTYDGAQEQADPTWAGASWYGPSSGEYWRVNPREYADPRKHGPEYLAKAAARAAAAAERRTRQGSPEPAPRAPGGSAGPSPAGKTGPPPTRPPRTPPPPPRRPRTEDPAREATAAGAATHFERDPRVPDQRALNLSPPLRRLLRALLAWPPLGIAAAAVIGEVTGCAAFEASCTAAADLYPWVAQVVIILALLAVPPLARLLAGGTVAVVLFAFPAAAVLSAGGANYDRTYGPAALIVVLGVAWVAGVGAVLLRRAVARALP